MSYDLILGTHPNQNVTLHDFDAIQQELRGNEALQKLCEVTPGRFEPSGVDVVVLGEGLHSGDFTEHDFVEFCSRHGLPADRHHEGAASKFVRSQFGFSIATFKLPTAHDDARKAYSEIIQLALRRGLRVSDPQIGDDIDLQKPRSLPPRWSA